MPFFQSIVGFYYFNHGIPSIIGYDNDGTTCSKRDVLIPLPKFTLASTMRTDLTTLRSASRTFKPVLSTHYNANYEAVF